MLGMVEGEKRMTQGAGREEKFWKEVQGNWGNVGQNEKV